MFGDLVIDRDMGDEEPEDEEKPSKKKKVTGQKVQTRVPMLTLSGIVLRVLQ